MMLDIMLPWFPIILSAAVGARLAGPTKASWLGGTCALFWVIVVQTTAGVPFWYNPITFASLLAGSAAIVGMAHWAGTRDADPPGPDSANDDEYRNFDTVVHAVTKFDDWLERHRLSADPWPAFDEFVRDMLHTTCGATHVRPYRVLSEGEAILPLHTIQESDLDELPSARKGILGHVVTSGRSYYDFDRSQGELVRALAESTGNPPAWAFAIRQGAHSIGVVSVGRLSDRRPARTLLRAMERILTQFWITLREVRRCQAAATTDPTSQLLTREAFLHEAQRVASESYEHGEPVAVAVIAVEGLRSLLDQGRWELADDVVAEMSSALRERVRPDDVLGRFDDSRLLLLLRRVDSELATLIATQLVERLSRLPAVSAGPQRDVGVRCGVAGSGTAGPPVRTIAADAVRLCHQARQRDQRVASDVVDRVQAVGAQP